MSDPQDRSPHPLSEATPTFELLRQRFLSAAPPARPLQRLLPTSGTLHGFDARGERMHPLLPSFCGALRGLAQVIFINNPLSGLLLLLGLALQSPWMAPFAALGIASSHGVARACGIARAARRNGIYGFNGALVGCAVAAFADLSTVESLPTWAFLTVLGAGATTALLQAWSRWLLPRTGLVPLTLPFCLVIWMLLALVSSGAPTGLQLLDPIAPPSPPSAYAALLVGLPRGFGQVFLCSDLRSGLLVLAATAIASPLAAALGLLGALAQALAALATGASTALVAQGLCSFDGVLVAIALGGIFYAPTARSFALALGGAFASALVVAAFSPRFPFGLPLLSLPLITVTWSAMLVVRRLLPALLPVTLHSILTPEEHRHRYVVARRLLGDFRRQLRLALLGERGARRPSAAPSGDTATITVLFHQLDRNGDGRLVLQELLRGLTAPGSGAAAPHGALGEGQVRALLEAMDLDRDGSVDPAEFTEMILRLQRLHHGEQRLLTYLMPADADGDARLDPVELARLLRSIGEPPLSPQEEHHLFGQRLEPLSWRAFVDRLLLT